MLKLTVDNFDDAVQKNALVFIDFWAQWCGPCKAFGKVLEAVMPDYPEFVFASVDIEKEKALVEEFNIRSIPAIMILRDQTVVYADAGALTVEALRDLLDQAKELKAV
jgi:thioredoxin 1